MSGRVGPVSEAGLILLAIAATIAFPVLVEVFKQLGEVSLDLRSPGPFGRSVEFLLATWKWVIELFSNPTSLAFLIALGIALAALELRRRYG